MAGLFFCLASDTVQGFYFALLQYNPIQTFTVAFVPSMQLYRLNSKTVYRTLQGFFRRFALFQRTQYSSHTSRLYTACTTLEGIPSSAAPAPIPDTAATPDTVQGRVAPYYNKVYKGAAVRPCRGSMPGGAT